MHDLIFESYVARFAEVDECTNLRHIFSCGQDHDIREIEIQVLPRLYSTTGGSMDETLLQGYDLVQQLLRTLRYNRERRKERT